MTEVSPQMWSKLAPDATAAAPPRPAPTYGQEMRRRLWANKPAVISIVYIVALVIAAFFGPMLSPHTYFKQDLKLANIPPAFETYAVASGEARPRASSSTPPTSTSTRWTRRAMCWASCAAGART